MTTTFQQREQAFEAKFAHDEEFRYLVMARRDRLFAQWAAEKLALTPEATAGLVGEVLHLADGRGPDGGSHDSAVLARIAESLRAGQRPVPLPELAVVLERCGVRARDERLTQPLDHPEAN
jgi:hypothetical protein